jgi:hypothetical protein
MKPTKRIWQSKTFWLNIVSLIVMVLSTISGWDWVAKDHAAIMLCIVNFLNIVLRVITVAPIEIGQLIETEDPPLKPSRRSQAPNEPYTPAKPAWFEETKDDAK